ncbi:MAG TPA: NADPH:quinone oxidoreductase family protein, partial [Roseiflexaceae bacterium]|nr:NADPH:quinone oxidoreductase family protein [Roseiflexaceae bacterium]
EYGPPNRLVLEELPSPVPGDGEVLIRVAACGVNFPDTLIIQGKYQFRPPLPFAPGSELAGTIAAVGAGVKHLAVGDRAIAFIGWGGFAEEVVADAKRVFRMPDAMDFVTGATFVLTYGTSYHALVDRAQLKPGETLLVLGAAGGVGLAAVQIGKALGARVIAAASTEEKLALCLNHGADAAINYSSEDLKARIKDLTGGKGADVVYDPVGGDYSEAALRSTAWGGRFLVIGFAAGEIPRIPLNLPLLKGCSIVGVFYGDWTTREPQRNQEHLAEMLAWLRAGKLAPHISARYPLEQAAAALDDMLDRKIMGKAVVVMDRV